MRFISHGELNFREGSPSNVDGRKPGQSLRPGSSIDRYRDENTLVTGQLSGETGREDIIAPTGCVWGDCSP